MAPKKSRTVDRLAHHVPVCLNGTFTIETVPEGIASTNRNLTHTRRKLVEAVVILHAPGDLFTRRFASGGKEGATMIHRIELDTTEIDREFDAVLNEMYMMYHCHPTNIPDYDRIEQEQKRQAKNVVSLVPAGWRYKDNLELLKVLYNKPVEPELVEPVTPRKSLLFNKPLTWKRALAGAVLTLAVFALMLSGWVLVNGAIEYLVVGVLK